MIFMILVRIHPLIGVVRLIGLGSEVRVAQHFRAVESSTQPHLKNLLHIPYSGHERHLSGRNILHRHSQQRKDCNRANLLHIHKDDRNHAPS
jgi:hypothetical protein